MITKILKIDSESLERAKNTIADGGLVAFPTETVYGLGVSAYNGNGVKKVFEVKGRPSDNPLITHVADIEDISLAARAVTGIARSLFEAFSPGPITIVLDKNYEIADEVTAGLDTVGIRIPSHEGARALIKACGVPLAAPSANTSSRPSPTSAESVFEDLNGKIPLILDGGDCEVGIESTVVDCRGDIPIILREGKVTREDIKRVVGACELSGDNSVVRSPGTKYKHYSPNCKMIAIAAKSEKEREDIVETLKKQYSRVAVMAKSGETFEGVILFDMGETLEDFMKNYYGALRKLEKIADVILFVMPFEKREAEGLFNRVSKSTGEGIL